MAAGTPNAYQQYLKTTVETASQPQLLVMLFDAAVKKLHMARKAIQKSHIETSHNELIKVQRIFSELMVALDFEIGGELAQQLFAIYDFVYRQLVQANIRREVKLIDEVLPIVEDLREGWTKAVARYQEEERPDSDVAAAELPVPRKAASEELTRSASRESAEPAPDSPAYTPESRTFTAVSPAEYVKTRPRSYGPAAPTPKEAPNQRLNLRG